MPETTVDNMVLIQGGTFQMGDTFGDGAENETPVHEVTLSNFYMGQFEITVAEFRVFVEATGYRTSAESPIDRDARAELLARFQSPDLSDDERLDLREEYLKSGGTAFWDPTGRRWADYRSDIDWRDPGFEQSDTNPVQGISPLDAMHYCNWLSQQHGLPVAYDLETGSLLDEFGDPTTDTSNSTTD